MNALTVDRWLLSLAGLAALTSIVWSEWPGRGRTHRVFSPATAGSAHYTPQEFRDEPPPAAHWPPPVALSRGPEWVYDVFTPPEIRYDAASRRFSVTPVESADESGLELIAVKRVPFRLQLLGYVGEPGHFRGAFENRRTSEVFLAGTGTEVPELGLVITDFSVRSEPVKLADGALSRQWIASAVARDLGTDRSVALRAGELAYREELSAVVATDEGEAETVREVREGDEIQGDGQTYRLTRLQLEPATAELVPTELGASKTVRLTASGHAPDASATVPVN